MVHPTDRWRPRRRAWCAQDRRMRRPKHMTPHKPGSASKGFPLEVIAERRGNPTSTYYWLLPQTSQGRASINLRSRSPVKQRSGQGRPSIAWEAAFFRGRAFSCHNTAEAVISLSTSSPHLAIQRHSSIEVGPNLEAMGAYGCDGRSTPLQT